MLTALTPRNALLLILAVAVATIAGAWVFEALGYAPCELCLKQRWAYYTAIPLAAVLLFVPDRCSAIVKGGLWLLALIWLGSAIFGVYHSGVEWQWWAGPDTCGGGGLSGGLPDLSAPVVLCDKAAIRILGLSLAGWNALISAALMLVAVAGARSLLSKPQGSSSVSQYK